MKRELTYANRDFSGKIKVVEAFQDRDVEFLVPRAWADDHFNPGAFTNTFADLREPGKAIILPFNYAKAGMWPKWPHQKPAIAACVSGLQDRMGGLLVAPPRIR